jgi:thymidylate synthase
MSIHPEQQYLDLGMDLVNNGIYNKDLGSGDVTHSFFGRQFRFDFDDGFPLLTTKKVYWKGIVTELLWFLRGDSNIRFLVENNVHIWDDYPYYIYNNKVKKGTEPAMTKEEFITKILEDADFAKLHGELPKIYSEAWRRWPTKDPDRTIDQIAWILAELKEDPYARNCCLTAWNPEYLYSMAKPEEASKFPICHGFSQYSIKDGKLYGQLYQRTADLFLGVPFNTASYSLLVYIFAHLLGVEPGGFIHTFGDVHVYETHFDQMREQSTRDPRPFPRVRIDPSLTSIDDLDFHHIILEDYDPHPPIKAVMAMVGGMVGRDNEEN